MRKTACPVVWEGGRAQSRSPDPISHRLDRGRVRGLGLPEERARTRYAILRALANFPDARAAVVAGLKRIATDEGPCRAIDAPSAVTTAGIRRDEQLPGFGIRLTAHRFPPTPNGLGGKCCCIMIHAHANPSRVLRHIVNAIG